ncbi:hypothetical protein LPQ06_28395, partial [Klebsiella pneumoniae]|nr:hypothetical protein [Klebsiella pneumoniae]
EPALGFYGVYGEGLRDWGVWGLKTILRSDLEPNLSESFFAAQKQRLTFDARITPINGVYKRRL